MIEQAMIALFLPGDIAQQLAPVQQQVGGEPVDLNELHMTLVYLGDIDESQIELAARCCADCLCSPFTGSINGIGRFTDKDPNAIYVNFDAPDLPALRQRLVDMLTVAGLPLPAEHGFQPHVTLAYQAAADVPAAMPTLEPLSFTVSAITLAWGDERKDFPLMVEAPPAVAMSEVMPDPVYEPASAEALAECEVAPAPEPETSINVTVVINKEAAQTDAATAQLEAAAKQAEAAVAFKGALVEVPSAAELLTSPPVVSFDGDELSTMLNFLKTADGSLDEDKIGGHAVLWGNRNLRDLHGEWFTQKTQSLLKFFKMFGDQLPMLYRHGLDPTLSDTMIGTIYKMVPDDKGIWIEAELNKASQYRAWVRDLVRKGALGMSSGTLPHLMKKATSGEILKWPIVEVSALPDPAEPRGTDLSLLHFTNFKAISGAIKALNVPFSAYEELGLLEEGSQDATDKTAAKSEDVTENATPYFKSTDESETTIMSDDIKAVIAEAVAATMSAAAPLIADAIKAAMAAQPAAAVVTVPPVATPDIKTLPVTTPTQTPGTPNLGPRIEVLRATRYSDLSASDMSFLHEVMSSSVKGWAADEPFMRELADKSIKAVNAGTLSYDAIKGLIDSGGYIKSANDMNNVTTSGDGGAWAPDSWRSELWRKVRQENYVAPLFAMVEMPTNPYEAPIEGTDPTVYFVPETNDSTTIDPPNSPIPQSKTGASKIQMSAKKLALRVNWSSELNEDSIIPVISQYRTQAIRAMQNAIDNVLLNGDTVTTASTNINLIDGTPTATAKYLAFDGLRKAGLVTAQKLDAAGTISLALIRQTRFKLAGAYAMQPNNCAYIVDNQAYSALLGLTEFLTMDKAGAAATNLTGQIGVIDGVPVFGSGELGLTDATGQISATPGNNTKGQLICVFRPNWMIGYRRQVTANVEFFNWSDSYSMVVTARLCLVKFDTTSVSELYDIAV